MLLKLQPDRPNSVSKFQVDKTSRWAYRFACVRKRYLQDFWLLSALHAYSKGETHVLPPVFNTRSTAHFRRQRRGRCAKGG
jgi:hypothetical protein